MRSLCFVSLLILAAAAATTVDAKPAPDFVLVDINPAPDALLDGIQAEIHKAKELHLKPFVEFWASWCGPCVAIKKSMGDPRMKAAFKGTYIIMLNADTWLERAKSQGFDSAAIPVFFALGDDGKPSGRKIDGGAWSDDVPENMAPALDKFFHAP